MNSIGLSILETCRAAARELTAGDNVSAHRVELRKMYEAVLGGPDAENAARQADRAFTAVTNLSRGDEGALRRFANGWSDTHVSSDLVGLLIGNLLDMGAYKAARDMHQVIAEDIGSAGKPHRDMFATFANALCQPESWRAPENKVESCKTFRRYLHDARVKQPEDTAILTTAASEIWNVGEYTTVAERFLPWLQNKMGLSRIEATQANAYSQVHSGKTELGHFLCAIDAWDNLAAHTGQPQPVEKAGQAMTRYLREIAVAYEGLADAITAKPAPRPGVPRVTMAAVSAMPGGIR